MAAPAVSCYEDNDTDQITVGNPINLGSISAGQEGSPVEIHLWNNKGGSSTLPDMKEVKITTVTVNGYYSGDTVANGKEVVENTEVELKLKDFTDTYAPIGGVTMKTLGHDILGSKLAAPGQPTGTPGSGSGSVPEGTYYYKIAALDETGETLPGTESAAVVVTAPNNQVALSWTAVTNAASYKIFRTTTSGVYTTPALVGTSETNSFTDTLATPGAGAPLAVATVTYGHNLALLLKGVIPTNASSGGQSWNLRVLYKYTDA